MGRLGATVHPVRLAATVVGLVLFSTVAAAHVPAFPTGIGDPADALVVPDPVKSWSFYDELDGGDARYYRFTVGAGERLRVGAFTPRGGAFAPGIVVMSRAIEGRSGVPAAVTVPAGMGAEVYPGERSGSASYEPFAPSANYHTADVDRPVTSETTFLVAVYEPGGRSGPVGVTIGYEESFSAVEYVTVPFDLAGVRRWAGQSPLPVWGPWLATGLVAAAVGARRRSDWTAGGRRWLLLGAAALVLGSALSTALQAAIASVRAGPSPGLVVTALFVAVPLASGTWAARLALADRLEIGPRVRAGLALAAAASLGTWAGFIIGPVALGAVALLPAGRGEG